ncbi:MAG TPA: SGNH/GDSL hydrolase family protein [Streptosporangiaceae bacterium]|jgi:hypothetical protein|nr:SGNH/GDSL hydrolase family protein [Streptosporangiaceae bacterium]
MSVSFFTPSHARRCLVALALVLGSGVAAISTGPSARADAGLVGAVRPDLAARAQVAQLSYVALGDSYSSGEGNPPFEAGTNDKKTGDTCHRSRKAWPYVVAAADPALRSPVLLACSGATTADITSDRFKTEPAQVNRLEALHLQPAVITVTMSGDDVHFANVLKNCALHDCEKDGVLPAAIRAIREHLGSKIVSALRAIKKAAPGAEVILVGYPNIMNPNATDALHHCGLWLDRDEVAPLVTAGEDLNSVEQAAAKTAGTGWVSVLNVLKGHELCTAKSWIRSLTVGGSQNRGHPLVPGQDAIAAAVTAYLAHPHWSGPRLLDGSDGLAAVSCPTASFCLAGDSDGEVYTYSAGSWSGAHQLGNDGLTGISCASTQFCVATSGGATAYVRGNDGHWSAHQLVGSDGSPANLTAVSCPVDGYCVATGDEDTYTYSGGKWARGVQVQDDNDFTAISCPTTSRCVAVDSGGNAYTYSGKTWSPARPLADGTLTGVSCRGTSFCVATNSGTVAYVETNGQWSAKTLVASDGDTANLTAVSCPQAGYCIATGDWNSYTYSAGSWARGVLVQNTNTFTSISCASPAFCLAVDSAGNVFTYRSAA